MFYRPVRWAFQRPGPAMCTLILAIALPLVGPVGCSGSGSSGGDEEIDGPDDSSSTAQDPEITAVVAGDSELEVSWEPIEEASEYNLYYSLEEGFDPENYASFEGGTLLNDASSPHTESGLNNGDTYYLVLEAVVEGESFYSEEVSETPLGHLNDTGIDWCADEDTNYKSGDADQRRNDCESLADDWPGQDGMQPHSRDVLAREGELEKVGYGAAGFDFTKLDDSGNDLPPQAIDWSCVRDNHTGLIWEVKTNDGLRGKEHTYTWYNPDSDTNGGDAGSPDGGDCSGSDCDTHDFVQVVNMQGLCGANDWRMPTVDELSSITHLGRTSPVIDEDYFPNTASKWFWSASPYAGNSDSAWSLNFSYGGDSVTAFQSNKSTGSRVRLVRDGQ